MKLTGFTLGIICAVALSSCKTTETTASGNLPLISPTQFEQRYELDQVHSAVTDTFIDRTQVVPSQIANLQAEVTGMGVR
tara:strand:+ start:11746 stop:11985 length:240 start_codon:yes stop_codon:yes gene_type:complete